MTRDAAPSDQVAIAEKFAIAYLAFWSAPNAVALEASPNFYGPRIMYYGRPISSRALIREKRRFVRRWPVRDYRPRLETMHTTCDPAPPICIVRTAFDFTASSPKTGRRSQGSAILQLGVSFIGSEPMIVSEASQVTSRGPGGRRETFDGSDGR